jgi:hypothetical protein
MFLAIVVSQEILASEDIDTSVQRPPIGWERYLSPADREQIGTQFAIEEIEARLGDGDLQPFDGAEKTVTIPMNIVPVTDGAKWEAGKSGDTLGDESVAAAIEVQGYVTCTINTENAHAGSGPNGITVKAKSGGSCSYVPFPGGATPPTLTWSLIQVLLKLDFTMSAHEVHDRTGLNPVWSASSAQVFAQYCMSGNWSHSDSMFITPPAGWTIVGQNPFSVGVPTASFVSCP